MREMGISVNLREMGVAVNQFESSSLLLYGLLPRCSPTNGAPLGPVVF